MGTAVISFELRRRQVVRSRGICVLYETGGGQRLDGFPHLGRREVGISRPRCADDLVEAPRTVDELQDRPDPPTRIFDLGADSEVRPADPDLVRRRPSRIVHLLDARLALLVQEEQLRVPSRLEELAVPAPELQHAGDPSANLPRPDQLAIGVVQHTPVPEQEAARRRGDDVAERRHPVASWHGRPS